MSQIIKTSLHKEGSLRSKKESSKLALCKKVSIRQSAMLVVALCLALVTTALSINSIIGKPAMGFVVEDQFKTEWKWEQFKGKNVIMVLCDREGREYSEKWVTPLRSTFGTKVEYVAFADVSSVPGLLKGFIRSKVRDSYSHPLLLDWEGDIFKYYQCAEGVANVVFIDKTGTIRHSSSGKGTSEQVQNSITEIQRYLY
jgi:hypothetical protein